MLFQEFYEFEVLVKNNNWFEVDCMANVFIALYNFGRRKEDFNAMPPFFEAFLKGLQDAGNNVLCYQHKTVGREFKGQIPNEYKEKLIAFCPDLCVLFCNNFWDISQIVDCPIVIYDVDSPLLYKGKNFLKENLDRYLFVVNQTAGQELLQEIFEVKENQICLIPFFTEIQHIEIEKTHNISFLGTNWLWKGYNFSHEFLQRNPSEEDIKIAKNVIKKFTELPFYPSHEIIYQGHMQPQKSLNLGDLNRAAHEISGLRRINYLRSIVDLDLEIRGAYWNIDCMKYFPEVELCYNRTSVLTLKENEDFYNHSKISLSTNHIQAQNGFSFRVCDIMASGACLMTEEKADIRNYFPKVKLPTFSSEMELREKCKILLSDESRRCEIVSASNEAIEQGYRFRHVLRRLEEFTLLDLHSDELGELELFSDEDPANKKVGKKNPVLKKKKFAISRHDLVRVSKKGKGEYGLYLFRIHIAKLRLVNENLRIEFLLKNKWKKVWQKLRIEKGKRDFSIRKKKSHKALVDKWKKGEKIVVCLFVSRISCWLFGELYHIFEQSKEFKPFVVIKPFVSQGKEAMIAYHEETYQELERQGYRVVKGYDKETDRFFDVRKELNPDIIFYTKFWKPHFQNNFYITKFSDKMTFLVPYGFYVAEDKRAMNFELNNLVDGFFLATPIHKKIAEQEMSNKGKNVIVSGSPKLDVIWEKGYQPVDGWKKSEKRKKRIIWAPHHEDNTPAWQYQFDAFYELKNIMFEIAEKYKDEIQIAFKPHPMLKPKLEKRWGKETMEEYYQKWAELENGQLEEGEFIDLFLTSDAMIFDSISFIGEYTAVNKPALFTVGRNARVWMNEYGKKNYEILYHAKENLKEEICSFIEDVVINGNDIKYQERSLFIQKYLIPPNHKNAAQNIYSSVCEKIGIKERDFCL